MVSGATQEYRIYLSRTTQQMQRNKCNAPNAGHSKQQAYRQGPSPCRRWSRAHLRTCLPGSRCMSWCLRRQTGQRRMGHSCQNPKQTLASREVAEPAREVAGWAVAGREVVGWEAPAREAGEGLGAPETAARARGAAAEAAATAAAGWAGTAAAAWRRAWRLPATPSAHPPRGRGSHRPHRSEGRRCG